MLCGFSFFHFPLCSIRLQNTKKLIEITKTTRTTTYNKNSVFFLLAMCTKKLFILYVQIYTYVCINFFVHNETTSFIQGP